MNQHCQLLYQLTDHALVFLDVRPSDVLISESAVDWGKIDV